MWNEVDPQAFVAGSLALEAPANVRELHCVVN